MENTGTKEPEECYGFGGNNSCLEEIEIQLYTTLLISFAMNFVEIGMPLFYKGARKIALRKKLEIKGIQLGEDDSDEINPYLSPHSIDHQLILDEYTEMIYEYSEIILDLGYLLLFGVVAPLVPLLVLLLVYAEKFFDTYKLFFLTRVKFIKNVFFLFIPFIYFSNFSNYSTFI